jgi:hypothetical protein
MFGRSGRLRARWGSSSLPTCCLASGMRSARWFQVALGNQPPCPLLVCERCLLMPPQPQCREGEKATAYETPAIMSRLRSRSLQSRRPRLRTTVARTRAGVSSTSPWNCILRYRKVDCRRAGLGARPSSDAIGLRNSHAAGRAPKDVLRRPVGATCDAIRYRPPDGVRRAGFDTTGFDASDGVSVEVELVVAAGATCGIADTPFRATTAGLPLIRWTVA